jgi:hypothetical protein
VAEDPFAQVDVLLSFTTEDGPYATSLGAELVRAGLRVGHRSASYEPLPNFSALVVLLGKRGLGLTASEDEAAARRAGAKVLRAILPGGRPSVPKNVERVDLRKAGDTEEAAKQIAHVIAATARPGPDRVTTSAATKRPPRPRPTGGAREPRPSPARAAADTVPTHTDNPATVDALRREGFARVLASRIRAMRAQEVAAAKGTEFPNGRAFLVHLDGPWGSGKTWLLNFLGDALRNPRPDEGDPWVVVTFNAWQHQRIVPPWWWLMSTVAQQGGRALAEISKPRALWFRVREALWRASPALPWLAIPLALGALIAGLWIFGVLGSLGATGEWLGAAGTAVTLLTALLAIVRAVVSRTAQGARAYMEQTRDPMHAAKEHFADLVAWLHYPVAIFVDDLDRCKGGTVVELLEGMQTLFRDVPVTYVVAAEGDWLSESYERDYEAFARTLSGQGGRPFGYVFLEKTFQMSFAVPLIAPDALDDFWEGLIRRRGDDVAGALDHEREEARKVFHNLEDEAAIRAELMGNPGATPEERQARAEEAAIELASPKHQQATEHALRPFAGLAGGNPRALKRLVNAYGVARDVEILNHRNLAGSQEDQHRTALWTLLNLHWPRLGDYLAKHPDDVSYVGSGSAPAEASDGLEELFADDWVAAVVDGRAAGIVAKLDPGAIRRCTEAGGEPPLG